jgi:hypothetical protein
MDVKPRSCATSETSSACSGMFSPQMMPFKTTILIEEQDQTCG